MNLINDNKGFSLAEILVSVAILGIVMAGLASFFSDSRDDLTVKETREEVVQNIGFMHASVKKIAQRMMKKPTSGSCMKGGGKCLTIHNQDSADMKDIDFQFGTVCKNVGGFASTMNAVRKNVTSTISKNISTQCSVTCSGNKLPMAVMYKRKSGSSIEEKFFPNTYDKSLSTMVASAICVKSIDSLSVTLSFVGFYLNKQNNFRASKLSREFVVPTTSFTNSLQVLK